MTLKLVPRHGNFLSFVATRCSPPHRSSLRFVVTAAGIGHPRSRSRVIVCFVAMHRHHQSSVRIDQLQVIIFFILAVYVLSSLPRGEIVRKLCCYPPRTVTR
uniref:Uncharacterized protein n=1 Tax=Oryza sativa subsp. japonica TaxID=39947 RepID=Q6Z3D1_ORYSJ|nr:hypothetical protein [Oryza sativa Japonica Group]